MAWEIPPSSSHLYGWFLETDTNRTLNTMARIQAGTTAVAILTVGFRVGPKNGALGSTYEYRFNAAADAEGWLAQLRAAAEPGKVIWAMRRAGIVGHKV